jgi:hypothetical protein
LNKQPRTNYKGWPSSLGVGRGVNKHFTVTKLLRTIYTSLEPGRILWMDLGEVGWGDVDWIGLAQDRNRWRAVVNSVLNLRVP